MNQPCSRSIPAPKGPIVLSLLSVALLCGCVGPGYDREARLASGGEGMVCQSVEITGTRFPKRVCRTQAEWDLENSQDRQASDEYGRQTRENSSLIEPGFTRGQPVSL